jgi:hypothetical protein
VLWRVVQAFEERHPIRVEGEVDSQQQDQHSGDDKQYGSSFHGRLLVIVK